MRSAFVQRDHMPYRCSLPHQLASNAQCDIAGTRCLTLLGCSFSKSGRTDKVCTVYSASVSVHSIIDLATQNATGNTGTANSPSRTNNHATRTQPYYTRVARRCTAMPWQMPFGRPLLHRQVNGQVAWPGDRLWGLAVEICL